MGWASGSDLMGEVIVATKKLVKDKGLRYELYIQYIDAFSNADCDTLDECSGIDHAYDKALDFFNQGNE